MLASVSNTFVVLSCHIVYFILDFYNKTCWLDQKNVNYILYIVFVFFSLCIYTHIFPDMFLSACKYQSKVSVIRFDRNKTICTCLPWTNYISTLCILQDFTHYYHRSFPYTAQFNVFQIIENLNTHELESITNIVKFITHEIKYAYSILKKINRNVDICRLGFDFWFLMPLSAIFQLYHGDQF